MYNRWVHTSGLSIPQVHLSPTSDVYRFNFSSSSLLCGHGNALPSKKPKYTLKSSSNHPYELTYLLSKHIPETDVNQACCAAGNSEHTNTRTRKICFYFDEKRL